jgi:hypothetical protein
LERHFVGDALPLEGQIHDSGPRELAEGHVELPPEPFHRVPVDGEALAFRLEVHRFRHGLAGPQRLPIANAHGRPEGVVLLGEVGHDAFFKRGVLRVVSLEQFFGTAVRPVLADGQVREKPVFGIVARTDKFPTDGEAVEVAETRAVLRSEGTFEVDAAGARADAQRRIGKRVCFKSRIALRTAHATRVRLFFFGPAFFVRSVVTVQIVDLHGHRGHAEQLFENGRQGRHGRVDEGRAHF